MFLNDVFYIFDDIFQFCHPNGGGYSALVKRVNVPLVLRTRIDYPGHPLAVIRLLVPARASFSTSGFALVVRRQVSLTVNKDSLRSAAVDFQD